MNLNKINSFGFGIPAHNEAKTIGGLLKRLSSVRWEGKPPEKIVVVSDCSQDGTDEIVREFAAKEKEIPIELKKLAVRSGKPTAINTILGDLKDLDIVGVVSADCLPEPGAMEQLLERFKEPQVGVSAGRIVTCGPEKNLAVSISKLLWDVHHEIALETPKSTEISLLRNVTRSLNKATVADEAEFEATLIPEGYKISYTPTAIIYNQAPLTLPDYFKQRVRVTLGLMDVSQRTSYKVGTLNIAARFRAIKNVIKKTGKKHGLSIIIFGAAFEGIIYISAFVQLAFSRKKQSGIWSQSATTKRPF